MWRLEIHHIDVGQGDATLIVAREYDANDELVRTRSCLIDGGLQSQGPDLHNYMMMQLVERLDVIIATHYDDDHVGGVRDLLIVSPVLCAGARIYDQGWPQAHHPARYTRAINGMNDRNSRTNPSAVNRTRPTNAICSDGLQPGRLAHSLRIGLPAVPENNHSGITGPPTFLVGEEIFWNGEEDGIPKGAPTITCIAANLYGLGR